MFHDFDLSFETFLICVHLPCFKHKRQVTLLAVMTARILQILLILLPLLQISRILPPPQVNLIQRKERLFHFFVRFVLVIKPCNHFVAVVGVHLRLEVERSCFGCIFMVFVAMLEDFFGYSHHSVLEEAFAEKFGEIVI